MPYSERGSGKLFWCGYGQVVPVPVTDLITHANEHERNAFYISTAGFDSAMYSIARHCISGDNAFISKVDEIGWLLSQYEGSLYDYRYFM